MPRELMKEKRERAIAIAQRMDEHFPAAECALPLLGRPFQTDYSGIAVGANHRQGRQ